MDAKPLKVPLEEGIELAEQKWWMDGYIAGLNAAMQFRARQFGEKRQQKASAQPSLDNMAGTDKIYACGSSTSSST
jgi:hypothetical protein